MCTTGQQRAGVSSGMLPKHVLGVACSCQLLCIVIFCRKGGKRKWLRKGNTMMWLGEKKPWNNASEFVLNSRAAVHLLDAELE